MKNILVIVGALLLLSGCAGGGSRGKASIESLSVNTGAAQSSYTTKAAPVVGDKALITDSEDASKTKQATLGSLPVPTAVTSAISSAINALPTLTIDSVPTDASTNPVSSNGAFDALALKLTTTALPATVYGQKEIGWHIKDIDAVTAVADGKQAAVIPASLNGMNLIDFTCSVSDLNSAASGDTTVVLRRVRGATAADMTSAGVTIAYTDYTASDETIDTANDDVATGDKLFVDVNAVTSAAQKGLGCTALFQTP